jgi:hypothetical protein
LNIESMSPLYTSAFPIHWTCFSVIGTCINTSCPSEGLFYLSCTLECCHITPTFCLPDLDGLVDMNLPQATQYFRVSTIHSRTANRPWMLCACITTLGAASKHIHLDQRRSSSAGQTYLTATTPTSPEYQSPRSSKQDMWWVPSLSCGIQAYIQALNPRRKLKTMDGIINRCPKSARTPLQKKSDILIVQLRE